jgi:TonB family protein
MRHAAPTFGGVSSRPLLYRLPVVLATVGCLPLLVSGAAGGPQPQPQQATPPKPTTVDEVEALRQKAQHGEATAQFKLGLAYATGQGVPQDYAQALAWYRDAANQGDANALCRLATMYENAEGVPEDHVEACKWASLARTLRRNFQFSCADNVDDMRKKLSARQRKEADKRCSDWRAAVRFTVPQVLLQVAPEYPERALKAKIHGKVTLRAIVGTDGTVGECRVTRSLAPDLDQEATRVVRQWRFVPATIGDKPVPMNAIIEISFSITR